VTEVAVDDDDALNRPTQGYRALAKINCRIVLSVFSNT